MKTYTPPYQPKAYKDRKDYKAIDQRRGTPAERGYDADWRKLRTYILSQNPLCVCCKENGRFVPAQDIHHIKKIRTHPELRLEPSNLMPVCKKCHNIIERHSE